MVLGQIGTILQMGLIYGIIALGVYITYKILDFPDLSVDGTFPLGSVVTVVLINAGVNPVLTLLISFVAGGLAGTVTGILHVKLKISDLLSGILVMTALLSVTYLIGDKQGNIIISNDIPTILRTAGISALGKEAKIFARVGIILAIVVALKILMDLFLKTKIGFLLRATGDNAQLVTTLSKNTGNYKIMGLALGNALVALAGSVYSQYNATYSYGSGTGTVVIALASVIIGVTLAKHLRFMKPTTAVVVGAIIYYCALSLAMLALGTEYTKLVMAVLFTLILVLNRVKIKDNKLIDILKTKLKKGKSGKNA